MAGYYDKEELKSQMEIEQVFDLLEYLDAEPRYNSTGLVARTICHDGDSHKLYYYESNKLFYCYSSCGSMDIFQLVINVMKLRNNYDWELYDAMSYIASYFGFSSSAKKPQTKDESARWEVFRKHNYTIPQASPIKQLNEYNPIILTRFSYPRISNWEKEGILSSVSKKNLIGYYPGGEQITIPHFDINNRLIGIRGRSLVEEEAVQWGKYRPLTINQVEYAHPLSMNLYHLNKTKENIKRSKVAIILESEKACLQMESFYNDERDISVACCGSFVSRYQIDLLLKLGVQEIVLGFDRQFQQIKDEEFLNLKKKILKLEKEYGRKVRISAIFDKKMITPYKASPTDCGREIFEQLLNERIVNFY